MTNLKKYICSYLKKNIDFLEQATGHKFEKNSLEICSGGLLAKDDLTKRLIFINVKPNLPEMVSFDELLLYASIYNASIIALAAPKINTAIAGPVLWLNRITNKDIEFILINLNCPYA